MRLNVLAEWFARNRLVLVVFVVAMTAVSVAGLLQLGFDDKPLNVFKTSQDDFRVLEELFQDFGSDDNDCIVVVESEQLFSPAGISLLKQVTSAIKGLDTIQHVRSLDDVLVARPGQMLTSILPPPDASPQRFAEARRAALNHPMIGGHLLSKDGKTTLVIARIRGNSPTISELKPTILGLRNALDRLEIPAELGRVRLTGVPTIRYEIFSAIRRDSTRFMVIGTLLAFLMATILFRRFWAVIAVATPPLLAAMWTVGLLGLTGQKFNVINTILPVLVMIVGFTDSVHLMFDVRHSLARGLSPMEAAKSAIEHLGIACALASFTTAVGFASLMVTNVQIIQNLGLICAIGSALAFLSTIILVPLFASSPIGHQLIKHGASDDDTHGAVSRFIARVSTQVVDWIVGHARMVTVAGIVCVLILGGLASRLEPNNRLTENIPESNESAQALFHVDEAFGGTLPAFVLVTWDQPLSLASQRVIDAISVAQQMLEAQAGANHPISVINLLQALPGTNDDLVAKVPLLNLVPGEVTRRFVRSDRNRAVIAFYAADKGTGVHEPMFRAIERQLTQINQRYDGVQLAMTGTVVVASRNINQMISDLAKSVGLASIVIFVTMAAVFRSWKLGLISLLPNAFPLVTTAAFLVISDRPLELTSVIVFSICLGIAVDDTIHVINRFQRELALGADVPLAIKRTFIAVGSALATTTAVLLVGFGSVSMSEMPTSQLFAMLGMIAIAAALIGDLVILPAMLACFLRSKGS